MLDFDAIRSRHPLREVAERTGYQLPARDHVMVSCPVPNHSNSTPSMILHLDTDRWRCFGCDTHGDVIQWVRDVYQVGVVEAARILDQPGQSPPIQHATIVARPSRPVTPEDGVNLFRTEPLDVLLALETAWQVYTDPRNHSAAVEYLAGRGVDVGALEREVGGPVVGHTPAGPAYRVTRQLMAEGFTGDDIGRIVGLIGRDVTGSGHAPKYLNPPLTRTPARSRSPPTATKPVETRPSAGTPPSSPSAGKASSPPSLPQRKTPPNG